MEQVTINFSRSLLSDAPLIAAQHILGAELVIHDHGIRAVITEVEAYGGPADSQWPDPAAHTWPGQTNRNRVMFGPAGHLYVYRSYGIHHCANITCGPEGEGGGVLIRAVSIREGADAVRRFRPAPVALSVIGRGPGNAAQALGITMSDYDTDVFSPNSRISLEKSVVMHEQIVHGGPRVGVRRASERPWRLWLEDESVSKFRAHAQAEGTF